MKSVEKKFSAIKEGDTAHFEVSIDEPMVEAFARLSGDMNPLHTDEAYAKNTPFGSRLPHGMIGGALFSRLIGMYLPGRYALYLSQSLFFKRPLTIGKIVVVSGKVVRKTEAVRVITIKTLIIDKLSEENLIEGEAVVQLLS